MIMLVYKHQDLLTFIFVFNIYKSVHTFYYLSKLRLSKNIYN